MQRQLGLISLLFFSVQLSHAAQELTTPDKTKCMEKVRVLMNGSQDLSNSIQEQIAKTLSRAKFALIEDNQTALGELSQELIQLQARNLAEKGTLFRVDPKSRWIDILPEANDNALNRLAHRLANKFGTHSILRYQPEILLYDAYSVHEDMVATYFRTLYLSHLDLLDGPKSAYLKKQMRDAEFFSKSLVAPPKTRSSNPNLLSISELKPEDYTVDYWYSRPKTLDRDASTPSHSSSDPKLEQIEANPIGSTHYYDTSQEVLLIHGQNDPMAIRFSAAKRFARLTIKGTIEDIRGWGLKTHEKNGFRISEVRGFPNEPDHTFFDVFLAGTNIDAFFSPAGYKRALILADGRTYSHIAGSRDSKRFFESYLKFLEPIYTDPKGLGLDPQVFSELKSKSLDFALRSEVITLAKNTKWMKSKNPKDLMGGMILVKSENASETLPLLELRKSLAITRAEGEIFIEMGRLGSLSPKETIQFLKIAAEGLRRRYPKQKIRIFCEGNPARARYFQRFGFTETPHKIREESYYKNDPDLLLEVDLDTFLEKVLKR